MKAKYNHYTWCLKKTDGSFVMYPEISWHNEIGPVTMATRKAARQINQGRWKVVKANVVIKEAA